MVNRMIQGKQPIIYGSGNQKRCFSFMSDVVEPIIAACETDVIDGLVVNIGPDEEFITINELAERLASILDFPLNPIYLPERPREVFDANCSADLARNLLNYKTNTSLEVGLSQLVQWIKEKGPKKFNYHLPVEILTASTPKTWISDILNN
jgi:UDP-glucose 4-epimerase